MSEYPNLFPWYPDGGGSRMISVGKLFRALSRSSEQRRRNGYPEDRRTFSRSARMWPQPAGHDLHTDSWPAVSVRARGFRPREKDQSPGAGEYEHIGDVERVRVVDAATGHVEEIDDRAPDDAVDHVGQRASHDQAADDELDGPLEIAPRPIKDAAGDHQGDGDQDPAREFRVSAEQAEVDPRVPDMVEHEIRRKDFDPRSVEQVEPEQDAVFRSLVDREGEEGRQGEEPHPRRGRPVPAGGRGPAAAFFVWMFHQCRKCLVPVNTMAISFSLQ